MNFKKLIPLEVKLKLHSFKYKNNINNLICNEKNNIYVVLAADYGNLGDVAISYAQYEFLKSNFPEYNIVDVPISRNIKNIRTISKLIKSEDIITIVGGGNLTDKYQEIENCRLAWIKSFPNNKIISFPQTIDFTSYELEGSSFQKSKKIYESHSDLHIFARESISYEVMTNKLKVNIYLCPDIVLSQNQSNSNFSRKGIVCCIRKDEESIFDEAERSSIVKSIQECFHDEVTFTDTHIGRGGLTWVERKEKLNQIWDTFKCSEVVVTDRLHGMIFSAITKTPCVVILNNNHKISQTYKDWLQGLNHIVLLEHPETGLIISSIKSLSTYKKDDIKLANIQGEYRVIIRTLKNEPC